MQLSARSVFGYAVDMQLASDNGIVKRAFSCMLRRLKLVERVIAISNILNSLIATVPIYFGYPLKPAPPR
jgi:hypothetical protein